MRSNLITDQCLNYELFNTVDPKEDICGKLTPFAIVAFAEFVQQEEASSHHTNCFPRSPWLFLVFMHTSFWAVYLDVSRRVNFLSLSPAHSTGKFPFL
jgi:hypothetical protein